MSGSIYFRTSRRYINGPLRRGWGYSINLVSKGRPSSVFFGRFLRVTPLCHVSGPRAVAGGWAYLVVAELADGGAGMGAVHGGGAAHLWPHTGLQ